MNRLRTALLLSVLTLLLVVVGQLALVFARHALPYRGVARFAHARWSLSRFAPYPI